MPGMYVKCQICDDTLEPSFPGPFCASCVARLSRRSREPEGIVLLILLLLLPCTIGAFTGLRWGLLSGTLLTLFTFVAVVRSRRSP